MLRKIGCAVALVVLLALGVAPAQAAEAAYQLDPPHSSVGFAVKHLTVSTVRGQFGEFSGTFRVDEADFTKSSFEVRIKTASINTQNERRDNHLRSPDFFDVATHPEIVFKSKRIEKSGDAYVVVGDLTIRGVTKEIALPFTAAGPIRMGPRSVIGVEAAATINRHDFGVSWSRSLDGGGLVVADDVRIEISVELVKAEPAPSPAPK
jgi:polyisoprenoid-binding protein YceI